MAAITRLGVTGPMKAYAAFAPKTAATTATGPGGLSGLSGLIASDEEVEEG